MEKDSQNYQIPKQQVINPQVTPKIDEKSILISRRKKTITSYLVAVVVTMLLTSAGLAGAFLVGQNYNASSLDQKRQTVLQEGDVIADVAQRVSPSVVSIVAEQESTINSLYFGGRTRISQAAGTGLIIDSNGLILTNKHVVPEGTSTVEVVTSDGTKYEKAEIIGRDPLNDIAIIKVNNPKNFVAAPLADSDRVRTGQKVITIGNALGQFQNTVTSGIISGLGRPIQAGDETDGSSEQLTNLFQTDAAINSGNSGGPLLNFNGEVIGINTAVAADAQNIGFSIPINEAKGIIESVKKSGKVSRPYIGVKYNMLTVDAAKERNLSVQKGAYISKDADAIVSGSPAEKAGLKPGDVITKVSTVEITETTSLSSAIGRFKVGETVEFTIVRDNKSQKVKITLAEAPASQ